jgi:GT2 family glycosyltransferase
VAYAYTAMRLFGLEDRIDHAKAFSPKALIRGPFVNASAIMRTPVFREAGGFDPTWTMGYEDHEFWVRLLHRGFHGAWVPQPLLRYRKHGLSRNTLDAEQLNALRWRLRVTYPRLFWGKLVRHPFRWLYWHFKATGLRKRA